MSKVNDPAAMYESTLKAKYFNVPIKVAFQLPRKLAIGLALAADFAMDSDDPGNAVRKILSEEDREKLREFTAEIVRKGDVEDIYLTMKDALKG